MPISSRGPGEKSLRLTDGARAHAAGFKMIQTDNGIEYPINLSGEAAGMVESWGRRYSLSWGDVQDTEKPRPSGRCAILRRTAVRSSSSAPNYGCTGGLAEEA